jgi:N-acetylneuraminate lyase
MTPLRLEGLVAATFTPLHPDGSLNTDFVPTITEHLISEGITGIYINGTTGEGMSLTVAERCAMVEAYVSAAQGRLKTLVQVGHDSTAEAVTMTEHAVGLKVDAISSTPPCYFKPSSMTHLLDSFEVLTNAAPETPFYYYHIPALTGVPIDACEFLKLASRRLPTLAGIKYSHTDLSTLLACLHEADGQYDILYGCDESLLGALTVGCRSAVGSTYNFAPKIYQEVTRALAEGNLQAAQDWQLRSVAMVRALTHVCGGRPGLKPMMNLIGLDCGPHRLPQVDPDRGQIEELRLRLESMGFFTWIRESS